MLSQTHREAIDVAERADSALRIALSASTGDRDRLLQGWIKLRTVCELPGWQLWPDEVHKRLDALQRALIRYGDPDFCVMQELTPAEVAAGLWELLVIRDEILLLLNAVTKKERYTEPSGASANGATP